MLLIIAIVTVHFALSRPVGDGKRVYALTVPRGAGFNQIVGELKRQRLVRSSLHVRIVARIYGLDRKMQAGDYLVTDAMKPIDILDKMASGVTDARKFTLPEGYSIYQAAEMLEKQGIFEKSRFLEACRDHKLILSMGIPATTVEGYLFPGTYLVGFKMDERGFVTEMMREFRHRTGALEKQLSDSGFTMHQVVTLASMIEKEAVLSEEKPLISSVFRNRLKIGMPLQSDPTAIYGVRAFGGTVTKRDIKRKSPYNTYVVRGLPAGPIGSPGIDAIQSVLRPAKTDFLYFVSRKDGTHQFSRTLQEHNRGVTQFLRKSNGKKQ